MRKCSMLDHPEISEVEFGGDGEPVTVHVSPDKALAHAEPTRTHKEQLTRQPLWVLIHKALLHQGSLPPPPQDSPMSSNSNLLV